MVTAESGRQQGLLPHLHAAAFKKVQELKVKWKQSSLPGNIDELRKYADLAPSAEVFTRLGEEHHRKGVFDRAETCADVALVLDPHSVIALMVRAQCRLHSRDIVGARQDFDTVFSHPEGYRHKDLVCSGKAQLKRMAEANKRKKQRGGLAAENLAGTLAAADATRQSMLKAASQTAELALLRFAKQQEQQPAQAVATSAGLATVVRAPQGGLPQAAQAARRKQHVEGSTSRGKQAAGTAAAVTVGSSTPVVPVAEVPFVPSRADHARDTTAQHQRDCRVKQLGDKLSITHVQQIAALEATYAAERQQLNAEAAQLIRVSQEAISSGQSAIAHQKTTAQALAASIVERQAAASELTNQRALTHQLESEYKHLNTKMNQVTASFKALEAEHSSCGKSLRACSAQKQAAEQTLQQKDAELQTLTGSLHEARSGVEQLQRQVQQQTDALTAQKAASVAADRQVLTLKAHLAKDVENLTACTAGKAAVEEQLRQQVLLTQQVQQQLDELHQIRREEQHLAEQTRIVRQQAVDAAVQTMAVDHAEAVAQTSSASQMDAVAQPGTHGTTQSLELATAAEANAKMQQWMIELYKLQTEKHKNQVHLRSANTALKRHVAGIATHGQKEEKARSQLEDARILAEQEAEKLHVDCCQLEVSLWLLTQDNQTASTDSTCNTEPAPAVSSKKGNQLRRKREKEARRKACLSQDAADASMTEPAAVGGTDTILADRDVTPSTGAVQPMSVDASPDAAASASITDAVQAQLTSALDAATALNITSGAAAVGIHQAETAQSVSSETAEPGSAESISAEIAENVSSETAETVSLETVRAEIAEVSAEAQDHQSSATHAALQQPTEPAAADLQQAMPPTDSVSQVTVCSSQSHADPVQPCNGAPGSSSLLQKVDIPGPNTQAPAKGGEPGRVGQSLGLMTGSAPAASPEAVLSTGNVQADLCQAEAGSHASGALQAGPSAHRLYTVRQDKALPPYMPPASAVPLQSRPAQPPVPVYSPSRTPLYSPPGSPPTPPPAEMQQTASPNLQPVSSSPESTATRFNHSLQRLPAHLQQALGAQHPVSASAHLHFTEQPPREVHHHQVAAWPPQAVPYLSQRPRNHSRAVAEGPVRTCTSQQHMPGQVASSQSRATAIPAPPPPVAVGRPQGSWARGTLTGQLRQAAAAPQPLPPVAVPVALTSNTSKSEVQPCQRGPHMTAPTTGQSAERGQIPHSAMSNRSSRPAAMVSAARNGAVVSHPMPLVGNPRRVPPQGSRPQDYHNDSDKAWCQMCVTHGWAWYRTIRGDGECGFRAMAVGAIMAVHRLPNWQTAAPAFACHMGSLFDSVRPGLRRVQQARPDGATAKQGLLFFQRLVLDGRMHDPAVLSAACADPTNANSLVQLMRCIACEHLLRKDRGPDNYFELMLTQYENTEYRPSSMKEACFQYMAHMVVKGPGGTPDPAEPLKQATATVLGLLAEVLDIQVILGSNTGAAHGLLADRQPSDGPCWAAARICVLSRDEHFNLAWV